MKPEDVEQYAAALWDPWRTRDLDTEVGRWPFSVAGARVLDLAAGSGAFTAALLRAGAREVVWQDRDVRFHEIARQHLEGDTRVEFRLEDMANVDGVFDVVVLRDALHWAPDEARLVRTIAAALREGGWFVLTNHNWRRPLETVRPWWRAIAHLVTPVAALALRRKRFPTLWVFERLTRRRLERAGFEIAEWRHPVARDFEAYARRA